jgi:electron transfer flavoprotein alpha subunit
MFLLKSIRFGNSHAFVIADQVSGSAVPKATRSVISAAQKLSSNITVGVFSSSKEVASEIAKIPGVSKVVNVQSSKAFTNPVADTFASAIASQAKRIGATHILGSSSTLHKDTLPRVGAILDVQPMSDIISIESESSFKRPMYAGNVIATIESMDAIKIMTVRTTAFPVNDTLALANSAPIETVPLDESTTAPLIEHVSSETKMNDKPDLATASVVISGGRGLKSKENFDKLLNPLATKLKAAIGASRAAVDAGYAPNDLQVGQTGKVVAPNLYIAVGISGAIQHLAGMKDSRTIVAINKDGDAPIFSVADYGLVGDLNIIVPELTEKL